MILKPKSSKPNTNHSQFKNEQQQPEIIRNYSTTTLHNAHNSNHEILQQNIGTKLATRSYPQWSAFHEWLYQEADNVGGSIESEIFTVRLLSSD